LRDTLPNARAIRGTNFIDQVLPDQKIQYLSIDLDRNDDDPERAADAPDLVARIAQLRTSHLLRFSANSLKCSSSSAISRGHCRHRRTIIPRSMKSIPGLIC
jgi:hypothetical protein